MSKRSKKKKGAAPETTRVVEPKIGVGEAPKSKPAKAGGKLILLQAMLIVAAGLWVFWPAVRGDWLWDDDRLITNNFQLRSLGGLWKIWFKPGSQIEYYPVEHTMLWLEWHLWHTDTLGYHVTNIVLHLLSALLVWRLLGRLGLRLAWLGGLLFAIHPVQVESVAWLSELKNTLSLPLFLLSCDAWLDGEEGRKNSGYLRSVLYYLAAMLTKASAVMLPLVLLLYDWWKRGKITWQDVGRTVPYGIIALVLGVVGIHFQSHGHEASAMETGDFFVRTLSAGMAVCFYLGKFVLPTGLLPIYPHWTLDTPTLIRILPVTLLAVLGFGLWTRRKSWGRHALFGFGFFVLNLLPVLGFIKIEYLGISPVADHFGYLPMIGLIGLVVAAVGQAQERLAPAFRPVGVGIVAMVIALLAWESHWYAGLYLNKETLWTYTLQRNPAAWVAYNDLGVTLAQRGQVAEAVEEYEQAVRINPDYAEAHNNLGLLLGQSGRIPEGMEQLEDAIRIKPDYAEAYSNMGVILTQTGRVTEAIEQFEHALKLKPNYAEAYYNMGIALERVGQMPKAIEQYKQALKFNPDYAEAHNNLGIALAQNGQMPEAMEQFEEALRINPDYAEAHNNLGIVLMRRDRVPEAIVQFKEALRFNPNFTNARNNLAQTEAMARQNAPQK